MLIDVSGDIFKVCTSVQDVLVHCTNVGMGRASEVKAGVKDITSQRAKFKVDLIMMSLSRFSKQEKRHVTSKV